MRSLLDGFVLPMRKSLQLQAPKFSIGTLFKTPVETVTCAQLISILKAKRFQSISQAYSFDIDGTLTDPSFRVDSSQLEALILKIAPRRGSSHVIVFNSGRPIGNLLSLICSTVRVDSSIDLHKIFFIGNNGASFAFFEGAQHTLRAFKTKAIAPSILLSFKPYALEYGEVQVQNVSHLKVRNDAPPLGAELSAEGLEFWSLEGCPFKILKYRGLSKGQTLSLLTPSTSSVIHFGDGWNDLTAIGYVDQLISVRDCEKQANSKLAISERPRNTLIKHYPAGIEGVYAYLSTLYRDTF